MMMLMCLELVRVEEIQSNGHPLSNSIPYIRYLSERRQKTKDQLDYVQLLAHRGASSSL